MGLKTVVSLVSSYRYTDDDRGTGLPAASSFGLRHHVGIARDYVGWLFHLTVWVVRCKFVGVGLAGGRIKLARLASRRMIHAVADSHHGEHDQRADLNDVDGNVD